MLTQENKEKEEKMSSILMKHQAILEQLNLNGKNNFRAGVNFVDIAG